MPSPATWPKQPSWAQVSSKASVRMNIILGAKSQFKSVNTSVPPNHSTMWRNLQIRTPPPTTSPNHHNTTIQNSGFITHDVTFITDHTSLEPRRLSYWVRKGRREGERRRNVSSFSFPWYLALRTRESWPVLSPKLLNISWLMAPFLNCFV